MWVLGSKKGYIANAQLQGSKSVYGPFTNKWAAESNKRENLEYLE